MEVFMIVIYASLCSTLIILLFGYYYNKSVVAVGLQSSLPPSPPGLPIIGHLHLLRRGRGPLHRTLHELSRRHGPVFVLRLGSRRAVVVSSRAAAEECFTRNDAVLADRPRLLSGKHLGYGYSTISSAPYGHHWRSLRRVATLEMFSAFRLRSFAATRQDEVRRLLRRLSALQEKQSVSGVVVQLNSSFYDLAFNVVTRTVAGKRYLGEGVPTEDEAAALEFRKLMTEAALCSGAGNPGDFLPILNHCLLGGQGFEKRVVRVSKAIDAFFQGLLEEQRGHKDKSDTVIGRLLSLQESEPHYYSDLLIKGFMLVTLLAGTDTSAVTLEWAMANLLNNPRVMKKAKSEIEAVMGPKGRLVEESDLHELPYLRCVISETLRLHPAAPLLAPHLSTAPCTIAGFHVPRATIVLVNAWAVHRGHPLLWGPDPERFWPERFAGPGQGEARRKALMAFGLGRRACPGSGMAQSVVGLTLASLVQCFEWERVGEGEVDMSEGNGVTMPKLVPLEALCRVSTASCYLNSP